MTNTNNKIFYIDNIRVLLTILVIMHHTAITYGAPGGWYFREPTTSQLALLFMTMFVATNQAFFMGFFFYLAALFTEPSYNKKGSSKFVADRLKRLGIPLLFYSFILGPCMNFLVYKYGYHKPATFMQYLSGYDDWIDPGVMWFVAALLLFTLLYVLVRKVLPAPPTAGNKQLPGNIKIFMFALLLGVISYVVRIEFPVGWVLHPLGFQLAHFTQYIALFITGIIAYRKGWMHKLDIKTARIWLYIALVLIFVVFPAIFLLNDVPISMYMGNGTWQSFMVAVWEQLTGIALMVAISGIAKYRYNNSTPLLSKMSRAAYATYIIHPLFVISVSLILLNWQIEPAIKFLIAAPVAVSLSFFVAWCITKLPVVKDIV